MPRIAYFGPSGTFTEMALGQLEAAGVLDSLGFGQDIERVPYGSQPAALQAVRDGEAAAAVVPIESSVEGSVPPTLDALAASSRLQIIAETEIDVAFSILGRPGIALDDVKSVRAYPIAAAQVREWLERRIPDAEVQFASSNAGAAEDVAAGLADAAVSTSLAGERLGLPSLADGVADVDTARTRFVLVSPPRPAPAPTGADRTALVLMPDNVPGVLQSALAEFGLRDIDLTRIESRPTRKEFGTYRFFVDCAGHIEDPIVAEALGALHRKMTLRFLGSWPVATGTGSTPPSLDEQIGWLERLREGKSDDGQGG
ncbi:prephenate dehydratase [Rhodococcoides kyotonense]|uniref:Prephenate dehydratase n=1 Tax=Rhodococcoides kyotonense TaxID=398843 RepID=A0A177Y8Y7_9NOCA|nr:prephenate dehydratase [Rhodococcus kyotonensis]OAK51967.1 prephenate dehydratase [Rhodococcus kyotonensis]